MELATLQQSIDKELAGIYVISTDETLLAIEALDVIRDKARRTGFTERQHFNVDRYFKWNELVQQSKEVSLFGDKKIIEITISTGKPNTEGVEVLSQLKNDSNTEVLYIILLPRLDSATRKAKWVSALEKSSVWLDYAAVTSDTLPRWLASRAKQLGYQLNQEALEFLCARTEGNLLAAKQELEKITLLFPAGELDLTQIQKATSDVARYDPFRLYEPLFKRDAARLVRMLQGLEGEGQGLPLILWSIVEDVRHLLLLKQAAQKGQSPRELTRNLRIWGDKEKLLLAALDKFSIAALRHTLLLLLEIDRMSKGLTSLRFVGSPWISLQHSLTRLIARSV